QRLAVVASALADITRYIHVRQEVHLYLDHAVALAGLAAAALDVKGEATWVVTAQTCLGHAGEQLTNSSEHARVGGRITARGTTNWGLIDVDDLVEMLQAFHTIVGRRFGMGTVQQMREGGCQRVV